MAASACLDVYKECKQAIRVYEGATLNIYGQTDNSGKLNAKSSGSGAGIGGKSSESGCAINIYGGTVNAKAQDSTRITEYAGAGIGSGAGGTSQNISIWRVRGRCSRRRTDCRAWTMAS